MRSEKIDPSLLGLLNDLETDGQEALAAHSSMLGFEQSGAEAPTVPSVNTFIRYESAAALADLQALGVRIHSAGSGREGDARVADRGQRGGGICTATVPLIALSEVSDLDAVREIDASRYLKLAMDVATQAINIPPFRTRTGTSGRGVVLGVVDSGIDGTHAVFNNRIDRVWDQTVMGTGVSAGAYGVELTGSAIATATDANGHGTHVAGIAGGLGPKFEGVAPDATFVIVKTTMQNTHIADGIRYIFDTADAMGAPAVVNLSLGGHFDPHDGTDPLSLLIDSEVGPGHIVCCAAGNEGTDDIHGEVQIGAGATGQLSFAVPANTVRVALLNGWYRGGTALEVAVETPGGATTPFQAVTSGPGATVTYTLPGARARIATPTVNPGNGDMRFVVEVFGPGAGTAVADGTWRLRLRHASGPATAAHVWALDDTGGSVFFTGGGVAHSMKIGSPGASAEAVTVASYTTKVTWIDSSGSTRSTSMPLNDISPFSSDGPLRTGAKKPDLAAPGAMIAAALSSGSSPSAGVILSSDFRVNAGTSMATPFVSGLVALLLERDKTLDPAGLKTLLGGHCRVPGQAAGAFHQKWGLGLVDAMGL